MLDDAFKRLIEQELAEIGSLLSRSRDVLQIPDGGEPSFERLAALSQILNSFYTGLERIFERITGHVHNSVPEGERWHAALLGQVSRPTPHRAAVISEECHARLREYLAFRHRSRHAYAHHIAWGPMRHLVQDRMEVWAVARTEVRRFLEDDPGPKSG